jgi:hypothetical protein
VMPNHENHVCNHACMLHTHLWSMRDFKGFLRSAFACTAVYVCARFLSCDMHAQLCVCAFAFLIRLFSVM